MFWFATPRTPPLWQRGFVLVNCLALRRFLASERSGVVDTFFVRYQFFMKPAIVIVVVLCVLAFAAFLLLRGRSSESGAFGFRDWVSNPDYKQEAAQYFADRDALSVSDNISQSEIQKMVDRLFVKEDDDFNLDKLKLVGDKATPALIAALNADRTFDAKFSDDYGGSPFERICDLLEETCPSAAVGPLARYASHPDDHFRKHAALALGNIGTEDCVEPIVKLLGDEDDYVRSYSMMGIERGIDDQCTRSFLDSVFPALVLLLDRNDSSIGGDAPKLMLAINQERAIPVMLSDKYFTPANDELHYIIQAFNQAGLTIPHDSLLPLIDKLKPLVADYPHDYQLGATLVAYSQNPDSNTEALLLEFRDSPKSRIAEAAADGLAILSGVTNPTGFVFEKLDARGWNGLSEPQKNYFAVFIYDAEVNNGGHSQYFLNSSGDNHVTALAGLRAIGATERAEVLSQAVKVFGDSGAPVDNDKRHQQLAAFTEAQESEIDSLDSQYYKCDENIEVSLTSYAVANKEHFSDAK